MLYRKREISATPIQLHLKELYGECYPHTVAPNPEMKAVTYTGKTFGRCQYFFFSKSWVVVACSFWVAHVITRRKSFATGSAFERKMYSMSRVPYNKLLTNLACSSRIGEYWPSVVFVRTSRCSVRTVTTSGQYSPVRPSRSVSKRLVLRWKSSKLKCKNIDYFSLTIFIYRSSKKPDEKKVKKTSKIWQN